MNFHGYGWLSLLVPSGGGTCFEGKDWTAARWARYQVRWAPTEAPHSRNQGNRQALFKYGVGMRWPQIFRFPHALGSLGSQASLRTRLPVRGGFVNYSRQSWEICPQNLWIAPAVWQVWTPNSGSCLLDKVKIPPLSYKLLNSQTFERAKLLSSETQMECQGR